MANEVQRYSFEGDTSSLSAAVRQAISLLGQYAKQLQDLEKQGKMKGSTASMDAMKQSLLEVTRQLKSLHEMLKRVTDVNLKSNGSAWANMQSAILGLVTSLSEMRKGNTLAEADLLRMSEALNKVATNFSNVYNKTNNAKVGFTSTAQSAKNAGEALKLLNTGATQSATAGKSSAAAWKASSVAMSAAGVAASLAGKRIVAAAASISRAATSAGKFILQMVSALNRLVTSSSRAATSSRKLTTSIGGIASVSKLARDALGLFGSIQIGKWFADAAKESISYVENLNLFNVAMRESIDVGKKFVDTVSELYGMDPSNVMRHVGLFYQLSAAMEAPQAASEKLSIGLTSLGIDLASVFNMNISQVMDNLVSGTQGMSRAVRKYGLDIRISTLQQEAMLLGIKTQVATMSEASRQGLRYLAMMKQARALQSDFAKTIESPANQLRVLTEQMARFGRSVGNFMIGPLTSVLPYINAVVMALRMLLEGLAALAGFKPLDFGGSVIGDAEDVVSGIGSAADSSAKKLKKMLAPFDEINTLGQKTSGGAAGLDMSDMMDPRIAEAMAALEYKMLDIEMKANRVRDAILAFTGLSFDVEGNIKYNPGVFEENLKTKFPEWALTIEAIFKNWGPTISGIGAVFSSIVEVVKLGVQPIKDFFSGMRMDEATASFLNGLPSSLEQLSTWIDNNQEKLASTLQVVLGVAAAFKAWQLVIVPLLTFLTPVLGFLATMSPLALVLSGLILALAGAFVYLYTTNEQFKASVDTLIAQIRDALSPILERVKELFISAFETLKTAWENDGKPAWDKFMENVKLLGEILSSTWETIIKPVLETLGTTISDLWENHIQPAIGKAIELFFELSETVNDLTKPFLEFIQYVVDTWGPLITTTIQWVVEQLGISFGFIFDVIGVFLGILKGVLEFIVGVFTGDWERAWNGIKTIFEGVADLISALFTGSMDAIELGFNTFKGIFQGLWEGFWDSIFGFFDGIVTKIQNTFSGVLESVTGVIDKVKNIKLPSLSDIGSGIGNTLKNAGSAIMNVIPKFATGGFPDMGQMFIAREAGAELVGNIGGSTAVMNNDQIVAAVSAGVANAVKAVMGSMQSGEGEYILAIDSIEFGRVMKKSINDLQRQTGTAAITL